MPLGKTAVTVCMPTAYELCFRRADTTRGESCNDFFLKKNGGSWRDTGEKDQLQVAVSPQPLDLGSRVPVYDIALTVLEGPGHHEQDVSLANPDPFLDLPLDPAHPGDPVKTPHPDVVGPHHQFGAGEDLAVPLVREAYPDDLLRRFPLTRSLVSQYINSIRPRPGTPGSP